MSTKPQVFNPFGGDAAASQASNAEAKKLPYKTTGVSARDSVRKTLFDTFKNEGHSEADSALACE